MNVKWGGVCLYGMAWMFWVGACHAQSVTPEDEYKLLIKVNQEISPLGAHPFGEHISLYDGTLSFEQTDIRVPGNGPTLELSRSLKTASIAVNFFPQSPFGDWDLDIPRIETDVAAPTLSVSGAIWQVEGGGTARCSDFKPPPVYGPTQPGADPWTPDQWWHGYHLNQSGVPPALPGRQ